jgi:beta-N-acetylhexosaminidase
MSLGPLMIDLEGTALSEQERQWLESPLVGGVILFARNYTGREQLEQLVAMIHAVRQPPLLVAVDQEGGRVQRFQAPFFRLPPLRALGHLYDEDPQAGLAAATSFGWLMAAELRSVGIDLSFAPVVELDRGLADVIGDRALHPNANAVARLAVRFAAGAKRAGMAATAKHFPTHAGAKSDSHSALAVDRRPYEDLADDLQPYRRLIEWGLQSIMVAHVSFPELDAAPASLSEWWIGTQLRGELGFTGAVISDDVSMAGAAAAGSIPQRVRRTLEAGCDLALLCNSRGQIASTLEALRGYVNPLGQLRLTRLHGRDRMDWDTLHSSVQWQEAHGALEALCKRPELRLEG